MKPRGAQATGPDLFSDRETEPQARAERAARAQRLIRIPLSWPLAQAAARMILDQYQKEGEAPEALARLLILVPTRRAVRTLREALLAESGGVPLLLPRIQPVGEAADDEAIFAQLLGDPQSAEAMLALPPAMEEPERQLRMTQLLTRLEPHLPLEQVASLALSLLEVIDDCQRHGCHAESMTGLVPETLSEHWQKVLRVLKVLWEFWPGIVAEAGKIDPIARRDALLHLLADHWERVGSAHPVLAVGTLGSQKASARLLKAVIGMEQGRLILPALDEGMNAEAWKAAGPSHPAHQYCALLKILELELEREDLLPLDVHAPASPRALLLHESLLPADLTDQWRNPVLSAEDLAQATHGLRIATAASGALEAQAIALMLREAVEVPERTAALITPDRMLAEQVKAALARFDVAVDDSAGTPLLRTPLGRLFQSAMDAVSSSLPPVELLGLLKHPLCRMEQPRGEWLAQVRRLERLALRGVRPAFGPAGLLEALRRLPEMEKKQARNSAAARIALEPWLQSVMEALQPLHAAFHAPASGLGLAALLTTHIALLERLTTDEHGEVLLWQQPESAALLNALEGLQRHAAQLPALGPQHYPPLMVVLLAGASWRPLYGTHPRLHILSPQEARLQTYDLLVLGGLNEDIWPTPQDAGPWMSRPMRVAAGLNSTDESLGLQALDYFLLANAPNVVLSYATRQNGAAAVPSRFVQRLHAVLSAYTQAGMPANLRENRWTHWAEQLNQWSGAVEPITRPAPCPPVEARPRKLAVTRIDTLLSNPYDLYASHILGLRELQGLDAEPEASDYGNLIHQVLEDLAKEFLNGWTERFEDRFWDIVAEKLEVWAHFPLLQTYARAQMARLAVWLLPLEESRRAEATDILPEQTLTHTWNAPGGPFTLTARIDRTELLPGEKLRLVDYKTGGVPSKADFAQGRSNQLPLQGWMVQQGAWQGRTLDRLEFWKLNADEEDEAVLPLESIAKREGTGLYAEAGAAAQAIVFAYDQPDQPYRAEPSPQNVRWHQTYAHLARQGEWEE